MSNVISFNDVSLRFGGVQALKNVSFEIEENSLFAIIGPNGAGKTSIFNVIAIFDFGWDFRINFRLLWW